MSADITIYHNPVCGTSRTTLAAIRDAGFEPHVIEYLKTPPTRQEFLQLLERAGVTARDFMRDRGELYEELGLANPALSDEALIDAIMAHPALMNRPIVVTARGVRLCRPSELFRELLP
jgi:arsenate reductase